MARTKKGGTAAPEAAQEPMQVQDAYRDLMEPEEVPAAPEPVQTGPAAGEIIGPEDESELLGGQDEAVPADGLLQSYAVTAKGGLRLRAEPSLEAQVLAVIPCGAGVFGEAGPAEAGWRQVLTGRLSGWMLARRLEELPELMAYGAD